MSSLHSELLLDHFRNPRNPGVLPAPAVTVDVENPACGDWLRISAEIADGRIARTGFQVRGCTASIAAGSALSEWLKGRKPADVARMRPAEIISAIESMLGGLTLETKHAAALAADGALSLSQSAAGAGR